MGFHSLFQGIFPTQALNPGLLHCRQILYHLSPQGSPQPCLVLCHFISVKTHATTTTVRIQTAASVLLPCPGTATSLPPLLTPGNGDQFLVNEQLLILVCKLPCQAREDLDIDINEINRKAQWLQVQAGTRLTGFSSWVCRLPAL